MKRLLSILVFVFVACSSDKCPIEVDIKLCIDACVKRLTLRDNNNVPLNHAMLYCSNFYLTDGFGKCYFAKYTRSFMYMDRPHSSNYGLLRPKATCVVAGSEEDK